MTATKTPHTPTPWAADNGDGQYFGVFDARGAAVAYLVEPKTEALLPNAGGRGPIEEADAWREHRANAEFIVRAANAHDELVATLRIALGELRTLSGRVTEHHREDVARCVDILRATLAKVDPS